MNKLPENIKRKETLYEFVASTFPRGTAREVIDLRYRTILHYAKKRFSDEMEQEIQRAKEEERDRIIAILHGTEPDLAYRIIDKLYKKNELLTQKEVE